MYRVALLLCLSSVTYAATLKPEAVQAWDRYLDSAKEKLAKRLQPNETFLWLDESAERRKRVLDGEIVVEETYPGLNKKGLGAAIHDWIGASFIPGARVDEVIAVVRNYGHYKSYYSPTVLRSQTLEQNGSIDRFSLVMMNQSLLRIAVQTDCQAIYTRLSEKRWYAISMSTRIQEIENYGGNKENRIKVDEGGGYLWRLASITRFAERDGGVYIEVEVLALSRDVPAALRFFVDPIVRRVSRNSLVESLQQTGKAVNELLAVDKRDQLERPRRPAAILGMAITNP